jgi:hypothetical protein
VFLYHGDGANVSSNRINLEASLVVEWSSPSHSPTLPAHPCGSKDESSREIRVQGRTYNTYNASRSAKHGMNYKLLII